MGDTYLALAIELIAIIERRTDIATAACSSRHSRPGRPLTDGTKQGPVGARTTSGMGPVRTHAVQLRGSSRVGYLPLTD